MLLSLGGAELCIEIFVRHLAGSMVEMTGGDQKPGFETHRVFSGVEMAGTRVHDAGARAQARDSA